MVFLALSSWSLNTLQIRHLHCNEWWNSNYGLLPEQLRLFCQLCTCSHGNHVKMHVQVILLFSCFSDVIFPLFRAPFTESLRPKLKF